MKKLKTTLFLFLFSQITFAQAKIIDSLKKKYESADEKNKILILADVAYYYRLVHIDSAMMMAQTALKMASSLGFDQGKANALSSIGSVYRITGDMQNAMYYHFEALRVAQKFGFDTEIAKATLGIGTDYFDLKELDLSIQHMRAAANIYDKLGNQERYNTTLANIGEVYLKLKQLDSAVFFLKKPFAYSDAIQTSAILPFSYSRLGHTYLLLKNYDSAYISIHKAIELGKKGSNTRVICYSYQILADYFDAVNKKDSAIYFADQAFKLATTNNFNWDVLESSNTLARLYEYKDLKLAHYYTKYYKALSDSLTGIDRINALQRKIIQEQELIRKKDAESLATINRLKQNSLLIGLGVLGVIGFLLYRNNIQKEKANNKLNKAYAELKTTQAQLIQSEKMASLGELTAGIAHEIQNPLNFVNNFSSINTELIEEANKELDQNNISEVKELINDIKVNSEKINNHGLRASNIVKGMLEHSRKSSGEKTPTDINAMCDEYLRLSYHGLRAKDSNFNCDYKLDLDPNMPKINVVAQDIARVLLNLINNAFQACDERSRSAVNEQQQNLIKKREAVNDQITKDDELGSPSALPINKEKDKARVRGKDEVKDISFLPPAPKARPDELVGRGEQAPVYKPLVNISTKYVASLRRCEISINDNGPGIPSHILDKIFQPFFTTKPTGQGTGLGLSLSYDIIKAHGGTIEVNSNYSLPGGKIEAESNTTTFIIKLPIHQ